MWSRDSGRALALAALLIAQCIASTAHAYRRSRTCSLGKTKEAAELECKQEDGCISEGARLHWSSPCLNYAVQLDGSPLSGLDADQVAELVAQAFSLWKAAECPEGGNPRYEANFQGFVTCHEQETMCAGCSGQRERRHLPRRRPYADPASLGYFAGAGDPRSGHTG